MNNPQDNSKGREKTVNDSEGKVERLLSLLLTRVNNWLKLKIKGKLTIAFVGFSAIPILIIGTVVWFMTVKSMRNSALKELSYLSQLINIRLNEFTESVYTDLQLLSEGSISIPSHGQETQPTVGQVEVIQEQVYNLMYTKPHYFRITFLVDSLRSDLFCYQRDLTEDNKVFPTEINYSWMYYRLMVADLSGYQMRLTPVEHFDVSTGKTLASFSFALPQRSPDGRLRGIIIADIFASKIFSLIETTLAKESKYIVGIVDKEGHFLYHSIKKQDWNRLLAESSVYTLGVELSDEIAREITGKKSGVIQTEKGDVINHLPLAMGSRGLNQDYYFYLQEPGDIIFAPLRKFGYILIFFIVGFVVIALYLSRLATLQFVRPINKLQRGSNVIARGNLNHRLRIDTGDEIEELANMFNYMAASIAERDQKLHEVNTYLEQKVRERTKELQEEKNKLQIVLDNVPSAFVLLSSDQTILTASSALKLLTGYRPRDAVGKKCFEVLGSLEACEQCQNKGLMGDHSITRREYQVTGRNGDLKTFELVNIPVKLTSGEGACLEILSDITSRVRLQNQLLQSEKLASIGEMAAVIAHEIRNSLTSANMLLQLIREAKVLKNTEKESLDVALSSIEQINKVTNDLLSFSRPAEIQKQPTDVLSIIQSSAMMYKHHFERNAIHFKIVSKHDLPKAQLDRNMMNEVFNNILLNSSQAIEKNGNIEVTVELTPMTSVIEEMFASISTGYSEDREIEGVKRPPARVFKIVFRDNGPGCPPENLSKLFDPFYTTKINGTGLGLSLAKRVIEAHGGYIYAKSALQRGMQIIILLPAE